MSDNEITDYQESSASLPAEVAEPASDAGDSAGSQDETQPKRRRPWWQKVLIGIGITIVALAVFAFALYNFGGMGSSANDPAMKQQYEQLVAAGQIPPVERRFTIPIPGCTCHSTDPRLTEEHRYYHMNECMQSGCHGN